MPVAKLYALAAALLVGSLGAAAAQGSVNVYCSVQVEWCQAIATNFEKATGTRVNMTQKGSGETLAQVRAEAQNPKGDVWFGGTGDPHLVAAEEGLTEAYDSPAAKDLHDWALRRRPGGAGRPAPRPGPADQGPDSREGRRLRNGRTGDAGLAHRLPRLDLSGPRDRAG